MSPAIEERVTRRILERAVPLTEGGDLDTTKLKANVEAETKDECAYLERIVPTGRVQGLGAPTTDPKEAAKEFSEAYHKQMGELAGIMCGGGDEHKAKRVAFINGREAA